MAEYRVCRRCVMDTSAPNIHFDAEGHCNFCSEYLQRMAVGGGFFERKQAALPAFIAQIKQDGIGRDYDCVVGLSGGVDSTYALHLVKEQGLRPLAVHLDNGWNSELAVRNIENIVRKLDVDLYTHVIEWKENRDLQRAFFEANVVDIELLMDNAMQALNYQQAKRWGVKYILAGSNHATEGIKLPAGWNHFKHDRQNIKAIHQRYGKRPIRTHLLIGTFDFIRYRFWHKIDWVPFLDYFDYNKQQAQQILVEKFNYNPYPYKHYESVFTRFYQGYILPTKFGIDKRRVHLSTLICAGQLSREAALAKLEESPYPDPDLLADDREFVLKKLGFTEAWFEQWLRTPGVPHLAYPSEKQRYLALINLKQKLQRR
ncbi:N-acetyl sugar amidotransferase [Parachitinimonas caeni]|uniref:N-acetyl sugar amidotransferase n=1 Tax=Parachitinimonas caeni TaxID=3031301 RepID=A0ABT7DSX7_9NEIS|nr:N-acetyl sugar amidotransferase [Parachitinimonas caeni]MDK2122889.1 N-acetyl sugar amidotransferase [Parachitinimonas caeni]